VANYRSILLLSSFSKVMERVIFNRLLAHFNNNNIIVYAQFGFWSNSSTKKATFDLIYEISEALN